MHNDTKFENNFCPLFTVCATSNYAQFCVQSGRNGEDLVLGCRLHVHVTSFNGALAFCLWRKLNAPISVPIAVAGRAVFF